MSENIQRTATWLASNFQDLQNIQPLSQGGQKQVFSAIHSHDGDVVLKIMHPTADLERIRRELLAVQQIQASRIPKILAQGTIMSPLGNCFWFREQRIRGQTVRECLSTAHFTKQNLLRLAFHISEILVAAETVKIVHRDVKPENIICDLSGNFWLIDFGLSRHLGLESLTATVNFFGNATWGYAPLEQCRNFKHEIDSRADLFALGVTLYECCTGTNPFRTGARDTLEIFRRIEDGRFPRLPLPSEPDFCDLVAALTQKQRVHRPRNVKQAFDWIKDICSKARV